MNCQAVRDRLMQGESLQVQDWPSGMNRHLKTCAVCAKLARSLFRLEAAWRDQPIPEGCEEAKEAFLQTLADAETRVDAPPPAADPTPAPTPMPAAAADTDAATKPAKPKKGKRSKAAARTRRPARWFAVAAMILIGIGIFALLEYKPNQSRAAPPDLVDRLIDWNLEMANADTEERKTLLKEFEPQLRRDLQKDGPALSLEERRIAADLLENGRWLAENDDPLAEAEHVTAIASKLADRVEAAEKEGNEKKKIRCGAGYARFMQFGVSPMQKGFTPLFTNLHLFQFKNFDPKKGGGDKGGADKGGFDKGGVKSGPDKGGFDKAAWEKAMAQRQLEFQQQLARIWLRSPEFSRPQFHIRFKDFHRHGHAFKPRFGKR